jgi:hypothetical protein
MTKTELQRTVNDGWGLMQRLLESSTDIDRALRASLEAEKGHRRFCSHLTGGAPISLSAEMCARLYVMRHALESALGQVRLPNSWSDVAGFRADVPMSYALGETIARRAKLRGAGDEARMRATARALLKMAPAIMAIDYAKDVADHA